MVPAPRTATFSIRFSIGEASPNNPHSNAAQEQNDPAKDALLAQTIRAAQKTRMTSTTLMQGNGEEETINQGRIRQPDQDGTHQAINLFRVKKSSKIEVAHVENVG